MIMGADGEECGVDGRTNEEEEAWGGEGMEVEMERTTGEGEGETAEYAGLTAGGRMCVGK